MKSPGVKTAVASVAIVNVMLGESCSSRVVDSVDLVAGSLLALKYKLALGKNQAVHKVYSDIGVDHLALPLRLDQADVDS